MHPHMDQSTIRYLLENVFQILMSPDEVDFKGSPLGKAIGRTALWQMHMHTSAHIGDVCDTPCVDLKHVRSKCFSMTTNNLVLHMLW